MCGKREITVVPLRWGLLVITTIILTLFLHVFFRIVTSDEFTLLHLMVYTYLSVLVPAFIRLGVHYAFCSEYLEARLFGIPFWRIPWDSVENATYLHVWKDIRLKYSAAFGGMVAKKGNTYEQILYVTLKGCPRYHPQYEIRLFHNVLHPFRTACIWLPDATKYQYLEAFKKHYPDLEMQPIDAWKNM